MHLIFLTLITSAAAQAVTNLVIPSSVPPQGCQNSRQGSFQITINNVTASPPTPSLVRRSFPILPRQQDGVLTLALNGGILTDQANRTGYIASNYQFQFDAPPQAGAIYTGGFSLCQNGSLALGGSAIFYQCLSGAFYNLYDRAWAEHCNAVYFEAIGGAGAVFSTSPPVPESTGPSEATIANGGGTLSRNSTAVGIGGGEGATTSSGPASASATASASTTAAAGSGSESGGEPAASTATATDTSSSEGAAAAIATDAPQRLVAWAVGIVGAIALV